MSEAGPRTCPQTCIRYDYYEIEIARRNFRFD